MGSPFSWEVLASLLTRLAITPHAHAVHRNNTRCALIESTTSACLLDNFGCLLDAVAALHYRILHVHAPNDGRKVVELLRAYAQVPRDGAGPPRLAGRRR